MFEVEIPSGQLHLPSTLGCGSLGRSHLPGPGLPKRREMRGNPKFLTPKVPSKVCLSV